MFLGIGGGPEGVLAASALDAYDCGFQGRFIFDTDILKKRATKMGIYDLIRNINLMKLLKVTVYFAQQVLQKVILLMV